MVNTFCVTTREVMSISQQFCISWVFPLTNTSPRRSLMAPGFLRGCGEVRGLKGSQNKNGIFFSQHKNGIFFGLSFSVLISCSRSFKWSSILNPRFLNMMEVTSKFYFILIWKEIISRIIHISISKLNHKFNGVKPLSYKLY